MIKALRKRHFQIWILWLILLPVGIIVALMAVPKKVEQELLQTNNIKNTSVELSSVEGGNYKMSIQFDTAKKESAVSFRVVTKKEIEASSLLLYRLTDTLTNSIDRQELLGRIKGSGTFSFPLSYIEIVTCLELTNRIRFVLYDIDSKHAIDTLTFNPTRTGIIL